MVKKRNTFLEDGLPVARRKNVPHEFVLEVLASISPETRPLFSTLAVYVKNKIVFALRDKHDRAAYDNGIWLATTKEHHKSLRQNFPSMRSIRVLGKKITGWQLLPVDAPDFEESAMRACEFVLVGDPRIGKIPASRRSTGGRKKTKTTIRGGKKKTKL